MVITDDPVYSEHTASDQTQGQCASVCVYSLSTSPTVAGELLYLAREGLYISSVWALSYNSLRSIIPTLTNVRISLRKIDAGLW